jgi:hypothetical protein
MMRWLDTWPPALWLAEYVGSLFVLMGAQRAELGVVGLSLVLIAFGVASYLAVRPLPGHPPPKGFAALMAGLGAFYLIAAVAASQLGPDFAFACLVAGSVPAAAVTLTYATARRKTRLGEDGRLEDLSAEDDSPYPGIGMDDLTPLGDSPELHDDITPHDLPPGHPARRRAEGQAPSGDGTIRGSGE